MRLGTAWTCCAVVALGCGERASSESASDSGAPVDAQHGSSRFDASPRADGSPKDAVAADARSDAAAPVDASRDVASRDAGSDSGPMDPILPLAPCTGTPSAVYTAVPNLPPMTDALRGDIVACTSDGTLDVATVQSQLTGEQDTGVTATSGVAIYRVQFRTTRATGAAGYSSARIYVPLLPISSTPPVIIAAHGTEGLASSCTTSMSATSMRELALPWASIGYPVIAPDYAGLGTPGTQGYEDNRDTARSVVDSAQALRKFVSRPLAQKILIDGHSQGAGAALATQGLAKTMGLSGELVGVLAFAPEYFSHMDSLGYVGALESVSPGNPLTIGTGVTKCTVATMLEYAYFANRVTGAAPTDGFPASKASGLGGAIDSLCTIPLGGAVQAVAPHVADWTAGTLRADLLACITGMDGGFGVDGGGSCSGEGQAFFQFLQQNIVAPDPTGAPVLLVQGLQDIVMPPDQEAACNVAELEAGGLSPQVCTDSAASHTDVVQRNIAFGIRWGQAVLAGTAPPTCSNSLPACSAP